MDERVLFDATPLQRDDGRFARLAEYVVEFARVDGDRRRRFGAAIENSRARALVCGYRSGDSFESRVLTSNVNMRGIIRILEWHAITPKVFWGYCDI